MVLKTVTYLGANILQLDMDNSNFTSSDSDGLVFLPTSLSDDVTAESYTTYFPNDNVNILWNKVELEWTRNTIDTAAPFNAAFELYGIDEIGKTSFIGEQIKTAMTKIPVTEKVTFDLLRSACEENLVLYGNYAPANYWYLKLPMMYKRYSDIAIEAMLPDPTALKSKKFILTGSSDGSNVNWACGPINVTYDADMNSDFSDLRFWVWDSSVNRWYKLPHIIYTYVASTSAVVFFEMPKLLQSTVYTVYMLYGSLASDTPYRINSPYTKNDNCYMGQYHFHSINSDGTNTPTVAVTAYRNLGYDWCGLGDHQYLNPDPEVSGIYYIPSVEYTNNAIDNATSIVHQCHVGAKTHMPLNPASAADLVTEAAAANITYNGTTNTAKLMRSYYITNGTFGVLTGDPRLVGFGTQNNIDWGLADNAWVVINHPTQFTVAQISGLPTVCKGYHAVCVVAGQEYIYDNGIDGILSQYNRFNLGWEDDTHTFFSGDISTTLVANVRTGTETSSDTTGWTQLNATLSSSTAEYQTGTRSLKVITNNAGTLEGARAATTTVAGNYYYAHVWVKGVQDATLRFRYNDAVTGSIDKDFTCTGDWQRVTLQVTAGAVAGTLRVVTDVQQSTTFYVDEMALYSNTTEGSTAGHVFSDKLDKDEIIANLIAGNYYITYMDHENGLTITDDGVSITATLDKACTIKWIIHDGIVAQTNAAATTATYTPDPNDLYVRIKATNTTSGAIVWSNPIWIEVD